MYAWPPPLQRARGDAAQAAFDRKLSHCRSEVGELRRSEIHNRPLDLDGGRTTAPGCHSDASIRRRRRVQSEWTAGVGEITPSQVVLRRRAAKARAFLPNPSARAEWLFAGIIDRALHHWGHVPALDGGPAGARRPRPR